jgi:hypothetical protein
MATPLPPNLDELLKLLEPKREVPDLPLIDALRRWRRLAALSNGAKKKIEGINKSYIGHFAFWFELLNQLIQI